MTRSEALEYFKEELKDGKCSDTCPICNAMEWAIKALEDPTWHKYPEEKPPKEDVPYLITCEYLWGEDRFVMEALWGDVNGITQWFDIDLHGNDTPLKLKVLAWTEMPEPCKENKR